MKEIKIKVSQELPKSQQCFQKSNQPRVELKIQKCIVKHQFLGSKTQKKKGV